MMMSLIAVLGACSSDGPDARPTPERVSVRGRTASIEAMDRFFAPTVLTASPGKKVKLVLRNGGFVPHNFTLPEQGIDQDVAPGDIRTAEVVFPSSGRLAFWCAFHRESDAMIGALEAS